METHVFLAVLVAAAFHATWNAMLKLDLAPLRAITLISVGAGAVTLPLLPFVDLPAPGAWIYIFASLAIHMLYYIALGEAYRTGDLGLVYPIARGSAPLLTAAGAALLYGERLGAVGSTGIVVLAAGIMMLSLKGGRAGERLDVRAIGFALATAATIAAYTLVDAKGGRVSANPAAYIVWLFVLDGLMMLLFGWWTWGRAINDDLGTYWKLVVIGGGLSMIAYGIAIWAMTKAPVALVAALRETSVLFAAVIGMVFLREPVVAMRIIAAVVVMAGMVLVRLR
jgi:drug/metabolite transporter (DMT)-like permease